jgi:hypothetical protein
MPSAPELLAPACDWDCVRAAIENGADAVYFGLDTGFNARARAVNFAVDDLPRLMAMLHGRGLKGYVTLNTIVFSDELPQFEQVIVAVAEAGVDAVLVQDVGAALGRLGRALKDYAHPSLARPMKWDLEAAGWILDHLDAIPDPVRRARVAAIGTRFEEDLRPRLGELPHCPIHNDLNDYNLLVAPGPDGAPAVSALLDFGDMLPGARVSDLAIAAAYVVLDQPRPIDVPRSPAGRR